MFFVSKWGQISSEGADPPGEGKKKNFLKMSETTDNGPFGSSSLSTKNWAAGPSVVLAIVEVYFSQRSSTVLKDYLFRIS